MENLLRGPSLRDASSGTYSPKKGRPPFGEPAPQSNTSPKQPSVADEEVVLSADFSPITISDQRHHVLLGDVAGVPQWPVHAPHEVVEPEVVGTCEKQLNGGLSSEDQVQEHPV